MIFLCVELTYTPYWVTIFAFSDQTMSKTFKNWKNDPVHFKVACASKLNIDWYRIKSFALLFTL